MRNTCESDEKPLSPKFELFIFLDNKEGELFCTLPDGRKIKAKLNGCYVRIVLILESARTEDLELPDDVQGFRKAKTIAEIYGENSYKPPLPSTMTSYVYKLCDLLETPTVDRPALPELIDRVPNRGARLIHPVKISYVGQPVSAAGASRSNYTTNG